MISGFWGETTDPDSVLDCVFPTKAAPNSGCDSVYSGMKTGGDNPSFYLASPCPPSLVEERKEECAPWR